MAKFVQLKDAKTGEPIYPIGAIPNELTEEEIEAICDFEEGMTEDDVIPKATKSALGCVVVGDGLDVDGNGVLSNGVVIKKLWQNASMSSNFSPQTITLDLSDYDAVIVRCSYAKGYTPSNGEFIPIGESAYVINSGAYTYVRLAQPTTTGVTFANGYYYKSIGASATADDSRMIPYQIFGVKGVS